MKRLIILMAFGLSTTGMLVGSACAEEYKQKHIGELANVHDSVAVSGDFDGVYITFVKGKEVHRCSIANYVDPNTMGASSSGLYTVYCESLEEISHLARP